MKDLLVLKVGSLNLSCSEALKDGGAGATEPSRQVGRLPEVLGGSVHLVPYSRTFNRIQSL